jgi:DNA polymerase III delta prime subunit
MTWLLSTLLALTACSPPDPVLSGIPDQPLLVPKANEAKSPRQEPTPYVKPGDVYVDVRHLCGQRLDAVRVELNEQLGDRQNVRELGAVDGREIQFIRGTVREVDGTIYMVSVPLIEPKYRRIALQQTGYPAFTGGVIRLSNEFRINNSWDHRRIRMKRVARDAEMVSEVEAWRWIPRERQ